MCTRLIIFFLIIITEANAQNYQVLKLNSVQYYEHNGYLQAYNRESPVRALYFGSSAVVNFDTAYYSFPMWRDTAVITPDTCVEIDGPAWIGYASVLQNGITRIVKGDLDDTIYYNTNAQLNDSWVFMNDRIYGGEVKAHVDSIVWMTYCGITDSVKCATLWYFDSTGVQTTSYFDGKQIWMSKNNGFFKFQLTMPHVSNDVLGYNRIPDVRPVTWRDVYEFDIGDQFEYFSQCFAQFSSYPPSSWSKMVIDKWYAQNQDSVYYVFTDTLMTIVPFSGPTYTISLDTVGYALSDDTLYTTLPEENIIDTSLYYIDTYFIYLIGSRPSFVHPEGYNYRLADSCYSAWNFEPIFEMNAYGKGIGHTYYEYDFRSQAGTDCIWKMTWYKKGNDSSGTYVPIMTGLSDFSDSRHVMIFPNPAHSEVTVKMDTEEETELTLMNISGQKISETKFNGTIKISMEDYSNGVYFIRLINNSGTYSKKILKF